MLVLLVACTISAKATSLYSTLGPSGEFDTANGYFVDGSNFFNQVIASPFTVSTTATLTDALLGLGNFAGSNNPIMLFVESDAGGMPGTILGSLTQVGVIPPFQTNSLTMFTADSSLVLTAGTNYWLVAQEIDPGTEQVWNFAFGDTQNNIAFNNLGSPTGPWTTFFGTDVAFQINGTTGVPESGNTLLLLGASLLAIGVGRFMQRRPALHA